MDDRLHVIYTGKNRKNSFRFSKNAAPELICLDKNIDQHEVDVVINPTDADLSCFIGENSSIYNSAGDDFLDYCKQHPVKKVGEAIITEGYDLRCKKIIHLIGPKNDAPNRINIITNALKSTLSLIAKNEFKTIALPAIGWNAYYVSVHELASIIISEIKQFLQHNVSVTSFTIICGSDYYYNLYRLLVSVPEELVPLVLDLTDERMQTYWSLLERLAKSIGKIEDINDKLEYSKIKSEQQKEEITTQRDEILKQKEELDKKNREMLADIMAAERLQKAVLPKEKDIEELFPQHFVLYRPQAIVSGDFYWIKDLPQTKIVVAADCTGHGVQGALMSMLGIAFLNEIVNSTEKLQANQILNRLRTEIKKALQVSTHQDSMRRGMDISLCIFHKNQNIMEYAGAYNPLYLIRNNELHQIKADKQPIAIHLEEKEFKNQVLKVQKQDMVYLFSDGFQDQFGGKDNKKFKTINFKKILMQIHNKPLEKQKKLLEASFDSWKRNQEQVDDVLVIGIRI